MAVQKKRRIPSNLKKKVPKPSEVKSKDTSTTSEGQSKKTAPKTKTEKAGKELPKTKTTSKGAKKDGTKTKVTNVTKENRKQGDQGKARTSEEATKPTTTATSGREASEPRPTDTREEIPEVSGQINYAQLENMTYTARVELSRKLNKNTEEFVQLIKRDELPKNLRMRKKEAEIREIIDKKPSKDAKVYYCPYCVSYMKFHYHSFAGYDKCIGCGMTTKDFYIAGDNELFNKGS